MIDKRQQIKLINVRMQFKKHFSSNLQNLSVKKTQIVQPPPNQIINPSSKMINPNYFPKNQHSNYDLDDSDLSNKESYKENYNNNNIEQFIGIKDTRRYVSMEKNGSSPQLTFKKIRRNAILMEREESNGQDLHYRKLFQPNQTYRNFRKQNCMESNQNKQYQTHKNVRLGSMVFGNMMKRQQNVKKEVIRQSKSFERLSSLKTQNSNLLECMNSDGQEAKYKVVRHEEQGNILYYCFNCAISLVKQGFMIQQLSQQDKSILRPRFSSVMSRSDFQHKRQMQSSRFSQKRPLILPQKVKMGEQMKCKIIMKLNKLKVSKEQFNKSVDNHLENIDYFYNSLISFIDQQRVNDRQEILRIKNMRKSEPQNYENRVSSCLGTIDYMMKNMQGISSEYNRQVEDLLSNQYSYPKFRTNIDPLQGFQTRIDNFASYFEKNLKLTIVQDCQIQKSRSRKSSQVQQSVQRSHHLRFSFEQALQQSNWRSPQHNNIPTLEQENQSQFQDSMPIVQRRQNAFRNLFPDEMDDDQLTKIRQSPVFKAF